MTYNNLSQDTEINLITRLAPYLTNKTFVDIGIGESVYAVGAILYNCVIAHVVAKRRFSIATDDGLALDYYHSLQKADA
jgi:hypothetical protein